MNKILKFIIDNSNRLQLDPLTIGGILVGAFLILIYGFYSSTRKVPLSLANAAIIFLTCLTFAAGVKLIVFALNPELINLLKKEDIDVAHIMLGGFAICWACVLAIIQVFKMVGSATFSSHKRAANLDEKVA